MTASSWLLQQFLGNQQWWASLPWGWLTLVLVATWIGREGLAPDGQMQTFFKNWFLFGVFGTVETRPEYFSLGLTLGGQQKFVAVSIPFTFSSTTALTAIRANSICRSFIANKIGDCRGHHEWALPVSKRFLDDQTIQIPIAYIPDSPNNPGVYGDKTSAGYYFSEGTAHFITIELIGRRSRQQKTVQILMPSNRPSFSPPASADSGGRFLWFEDGKVPPPNPCKK